MTGQAIDRLNRLEVIADRTFKASRRLYERCHEAFDANYRDRGMRLMDRWLLLGKRTDRIWAAIDATLKG